MKLDLDRLRESFEVLNDKGRVDNALGEVVLLLTSWQVNKFKWGSGGKDNIAEVQLDDVKGDVVMGVLKRLGNATIDLSKENKQMLVFLKGMVNYAIMDVRRAIKRSDGNRDVVELENMENGFDADDVGEEAIFDLVLDVRVNGEIPRELGY